jgi:hypothetical protein
MKRTIADITLEAAKTAIYPAAIDRDLLAHVLPDFRQ